VPLPTSAAALADIPPAIPASDDAPGLYHIDAQLIDTAESAPAPVGELCLTYSVGAPEGTLNLPGLTGSPGYGGPSALRGVQLAGELGTDGFRGLIDWGQNLHDCDPSAPTAAACGAAAVTAGLGTYHHGLFAAAPAKPDGVTYWIQVANGSSPQAALVQSGLREQDIQALVGHYTNTGNCSTSASAPVTDWEPWNEFNNAAYDTNGKPTVPDGFV